MRADTIAKLAWYMPRNEAKAGSYVLPDELGIDRKRAQDIMHYAYCHKNLHFGWDFVTYMSNTPGATFPAFLHKQDLFLWRAYKFKQGFHDPVIAGALSYTAPGNAALRRKLNGMLIDPDMEEYRVVMDKRTQEKLIAVCPELNKPMPYVYKHIADTFGLPLANVIAYEKLFFNVVDRMEDHIFIANILYPEGRMVEAAQDYLDKTGLDDIFLRMAYNNAPNVSLYMMGIGKHPFRNFDAATGATELDRMFMQDGILYKAAGFQNSDSCVPLKNARLSIQAGKMGNGEQKDAGGVMVEGDILKAEAIRISELKARARAEAHLQDIYDVPSAHVTLELPKEH